MMSPEIRPGTARWGCSETGRIMTIKVFEPAVREKHIMRTTVTNTMIMTMPMMGSWTTKEPDKNIVEKVGN